MLIDVNIARLGKSVMIQSFVKLEFFLKMDVDCMQLNLHRTHLRNSGKCHFQRPTVTQILDVALTPMSQSPDSRDQSPARDWGGVLEWGSGDWGV